VKLDIDGIRRQYADLSDEALLEIERADLVEAARRCYDEEVARRDLKAAKVAPVEYAGSIEKEDLRLAVDYSNPQDAQDSRDLLRKAGIRAYSPDDFPKEKRQSLDWVFRGFPLLVPASMLDAARDILETQDEDDRKAFRASDTTYIRHGVGAVRAYVYGGLDLLEFVLEVFGGLELERHEFGAKAFHVEVMIGDSVIALEASDPPPAAATPGSVYVYVADVDDAYARALKSGATSVAKPADKPYDERAAGVKDGFGNTWWMATYTGV
jgi:PhnB protein